MSSVDSVCFVGRRFRLARGILIPGLRAGFARLLSLDRSASFDGALCPEDHVFSLDI